MSIVEKRRANSPANVNGQYYLVRPHTRRRIVDIEVTFCIQLGARFYCDCSIFPLGDVYLIASLNHSIAHTCILFQWLDTRQDLYSRGLYLHVFNRLYWVDLRKGKEVVQ